MIIFKSLKTQFLRVSKAPLVISIISVLAAMFLPLGIAVFPTIFFYSNNVALLPLSSLARMIAFNIFFAVGLYLVFFIFSKRQSVQAANSTFIFLVFFNVYSAIYNYLLNLDVIRIEHYTLLPFLLLLAVYSAYFITKVSAPRFWNGAFFILSVLLIFNAVKIIPAEIAKGRMPDVIIPLEENSNVLVTDKDHPDIYFIILDEFAGFDAMRDYWNYTGVDQFSDFLNSKGFYVIENSHGNSTDTLHLMAERLNYQEYSYDPSSHENIPIYDAAIADNSVMRFLKSNGYTTVVFDERRLGYPGIHSIKADYLYEFGSNSIPHTGMSIGVLKDIGFYFDDFGELVVAKTMLSAYPEIYTNNNPGVSEHGDMIYFTVNKLANLDEIRSPKFVYVHLLLPHFPFMFDESGNVTTIDRYWNWNYYIDNYKYSIQIAEKMIDGILSDADPERPPVIILQSDHGARNLPVPSRKGSATLENYPEKYKTLILNAIYMPGYDTSSLPQDFDPINTFPIVFNHYFDANIPLK
jgi:hypothetical protein